MNKLKLSVLIAASMVVIACGGGGGGNSSQPKQLNDSTQQPPQSNNASESNNTPQPNNPPQSNNTPQPNNHAKPLVPGTDLKNSGINVDKNSFQKGELNKEAIIYGNTKIAELSGYNRQYSFNGALVKEKEDGISKIVVDGTAMLLLDKIKGAVGGLSGLGLSKALSSVYNVTKDPVRDIFYFGYETPESNIPKQGIVTYRGNASRYDNLTASVKNVGDAELIANFNKKTIKGELDITYPRRNIALHETSIVGNGFNGKAVAEGNFPALISREGKYEGKFYGPNAEEVAGKAVFAEGEKDLNTSFSAEKTK